MAKPQGVEGQVVTGLDLQFDGADHEFIRGNVSEIVMASSSISATTAVNVTLPNARGVMAVMNISSGFPGSASLTYTLKVKAVTPVTSATIVLGAAAARSASGTTTLTIYPGIATSAGANAQVNMVVPRRIQVVASMSALVASTNVAMSLALFHIL